MKKTSKTIMVLICITALGTSSAFARKNNRGRQQPLPQQASCTNFCGRGGMKNESEKVVIGTVKSADSKSMTVVITDTEGKDQKISVTPFTRIHSCIQPQNRSRTQNIPPEILTISDLRKNEWVMIKLFDTETSTPSASKILVNRNPPSEKELETINAK